MKKLIVATAIAVFAGAGIMLALRMGESKDLSPLQMENIDALTQSESADENNYYVFHMPQFDKHGNTTGKCTASCQYSKNGNNSTCHSHGAKECCH